MSVDRRDFLKVASTSAAALVGSAAAAEAQRNLADTPPETGNDKPEMMTAVRTGSDVMVDAIKTLNIEYAAAVPGSSFRGLHESCLNYGGNKMPEWITVTHEEQSVAMGHGYAKIEGKPMLAMMHSTVGLQHATMAIYDAYCDRIPVFVIVGNHMHGTERRPGTGDWVHAVQDPAHLVRDFTKFDDQPLPLQSFLESTVRAYKIAMTPPMGPVLLAADLAQQEDPIGEGETFHIPKLGITAPPTADIGSVRALAKMLVDAQSPVIVADYAARTPAGIPLLVELAETLQAPVVDRGFKFNFPSRHPLNQSERSGPLVAQADMILGLELFDFWGVINSFRDQLVRSSRRVAKPDVKLATINSGDLHIKANYQMFSRYQEVDLSIAADAEATLPSLIEEVKKLVTGDRKRVYQERGAKYATEAKEYVERVRADAVNGWDVSPVGLNRLHTELWNLIKNKDWSMVGGSPGRWGALWTMDKHYHHLGGSGGEGVGYNPPAAVGAALANKKHGRFSVAVVSDGGMMMTPGVLWTAAHHKIPLLEIIMHNNRGYHMQTQHILRVSLRHGRGIENCRIGTGLWNPDINFAKIAEGLGLHSEGPVSNPNDLAPALKRAIATVEKGEPALVDVVTQPR